MRHWALPRGAWSDLGDCARLVAPDGRLAQWVAFGRPGCTGVGAAARIRARVSDPGDGARVETIVGGPTP